MFWKTMKLTALTTAGAAAIGGLAFGTDLVSYVRSSCREVSSTVKDNVPVEFQIRRVRDLLDESGPEMQKNIRLMAEQEVDMESMKTDIAQCKLSLEDQKHRLTKLRDTLNTPQTSFTFGDLTYTREQLTEELAQSFDNYKQAEATLQQKAQILDTRKKRWRKKPSPWSGRIRSGRRCNRRRMRWKGDITSCRRRLRALTWRSTAAS